MQMWLHLLSDFVKFRNVWRGRGCSGVLENPNNRHVLSLRIFRFTCENSPLKKQLEPAASSFAEIC